MKEKQFFGISFFHILYFLLVDVPDADGVVREARVQGHAISGPGDGGARGEGLLAFSLVGEEVSDGVLVFKIPNADLSFGGGTEPVARRGDGDGGDETSVAAEGVEAAEVSQRPDLDEVVPTAGDEDGVLGGRGEADAGNPVGVGFAVEGVDAFTLDVPDLELVIATTGQDVAVIGGEGAGEDVLGVAEELTHEGTSLDVPEAERLVPRSGEGELSVVGESDVSDEALVAFEAAAGDGGGLFLREALFRGDPRADGVIAGARDDLDGGVGSLGADKGSDATAVTFELTSELDRLRHVFLFVLIVFL